MITEKSFFEIDKSEIKVNPSELKRRLCLDKNSDITSFLPYYQRVLEVSRPACSFLRCDVETRENTVDVGFLKIESRNLASNLKNCREAFIFAVTLGLEVDKFIAKYAYLSPAELFFYDGAASALAEEVCDVAQKSFAQKENCRPRFSPGYGDCPLCCQGEILSALDAGKLLGITLNSSFLMIPQKSVTAFAGIEKGL